MRKVIILSVEGKPEIEVDKELSRPQICQIIAHQFGYQGIHMPHSWIAFE